MPNKKPSLVIATGDLVLEKEVARERGDGGHVAGSLRTFFRRRTQRRA